MAYTASQMVTRWEMIRYGLGACDADLVLRDSSTGEEFHVLHVSHDIRGGDTRMVLTFNHHAPSGAPVV